MGDKTVKEWKELYETDIESVLAAVLPSVSDSESDTDTDTDDNMTTTTTPQKEQTTNKPIFDLDSEEHVSTENVEHTQEQIYVSPEKMDVDLDTKNNQGKIQLEVSGDIPVHVATPVVHVFPTPTTVPIPIPIPVMSPRAISELSSQSKPPEQVPMQRKPGQPPRVKFSHGGNHFTKEPPKIQPTGPSKMSPQAIVQERRVSQETQDPIVRQYQKYSTGSIISSSYIDMPKELTPKVPDVTTKQVELTPSVTKPVTESKPYVYTLEDYSFLAAYFLKLIPMVNAMNFTAKVPCVKPFTGGISNALHTEIATVMGSLMHGVTTMNYIDAQGKIQTRISIPTIDEYRKNILQCSLDGKQKELARLKHIVKAVVDNTVFNQTPQLLQRLCQNVSFVEKEIEDCLQNSDHHVH